MTKIEILKAVYNGINENDIPAVLELFAPDIERVEPEGFPTSGTYRGPEEIGRIFKQARSTWAEGTCEPENVKIVGNNAVVFVHVKVRLKNHTDWIDARISDGFTFRDDKIVYMRTFAKNEEALEWIGAEKES